MLAVEPKDMAAAEPKAPPPPRRADSRAEVARARAAIAGLRQPADMYHPSSMPRWDATMLLCLAFDYTLGVEERPPRRYYIDLWSGFVVEMGTTVAFAALASRPRLVATAIQWVIALLGFRAASETISVETAARG